MDSGYRLVGNVNEAAVVVESDEHIAANSYVVSFKRPDCENEAVVRGDDEGAEPFGSQGAR